MRIKRVDLEERKLLFLTELGNRIGSNFLITTGSLIGFSDNQGNLEVGQS